MIKVVVSDDNKILLEQLVNCLKKNNKIEIVGVANDGEEALKHIKNMQPDVVVTDIEMPKITGVELIEIASNLDKVPKFFVITGGVNRSVMEKLYTLPICNIYHKPLNMNKIIEDIEKMSEINPDVEISVNNKENNCELNKGIFQKIKKLIKN